VKPAVCQQVEMAEMAHLLLLLAQQLQEQAAAVAHSMLTLVQQLLVLEVQVAEEMAESTDLVLLEQSILDQVVVAVVGMQLTLAVMVVQVLLF
jgi:hypothetical protein